MGNKLDFDRECIEMLGEGSQLQEKQCFQSAIQHIELAQKLLDIDSAMCAFRLITAEEEAASGLMFCLKRLSYPESEFLLPHDHQYKHALFQFVSVISEFLMGRMKSVVKNMHMHIDPKGPVRKAFLELEFSEELGGISVAPTPPLNFHMQKADGDTYNYSLQMAKFVKLKGAKTVKELVKKEANYRNKILYASANALPENPIVDASVVEQRRKRVMFLLRIYLLIGPHEQHQMYVTHALKEFVGIMKSVKKRGASSN